MLNPFDNGTGFGFYIILPYMYRLVAGIVIGGSGALSEALVQCFESHGGTVRCDSEVKQVLMPGQTAKGVVLVSGEKILASKALVTGLHVTQVFPHMVPGAELPPGFQHRLDTLKYADFQPMTVHLALNEPLKFEGGEGFEDFSGSSGRIRTSRISLRASASCSMVIRCATTRPACSSS